MRHIFHPVLRPSERNVLPPPLKSIVSKEDAKEVFLNS